MLVKHSVYAFKTYSSVLSLQKELENYDQPFRALAKAFHRLYQEKVEGFRNLL